MIQQTNNEHKLRELLIVWEEAREHGESLAAEQLCRDCPELAEELGRRIQALRDWDLLRPGVSARSSCTPEVAIKAAADGPASAYVILQFNDLNFHDRGGLGVIYKARHQDLPRDVALKFIRHDESDGPERAQRFLREAQITARLEHPGIVPIYGLGRDEAGNPCYAMRFIAGTTLEQAIKQYHAQRSEDRKRGSLETDRAFRALLQRFKSACTTVGYAHSRGVLHRDIKPANIMLGPFDETLVLDWGLGKIIAGDDAEVGGEPEREASLTLLGPDEPKTFGVIGTPGFMSPEQHAGQWGKVRPASDIYALGSTLYVLLTGKSPFRGRSPAEIADRVTRGEFMPPRHVKAEIPRPLEAICLKAMALKPEDRYTTAVKLASDLDDWMAGEPVSAWHEPRLVRARRGMSRHRTLVTTGAVAMLLVVIGLAAILVQQGRSNRDLATRNTELRQARARAEGRVELALNAIDKFREAVADNPQLKFQPEFAQLRKGLLLAPQEFYRQIRQDIEAGQDTSPEAWAGLAKVILKLAVITAEIDSRPSAIHAYQEGLEVLDRLLPDRSGAAELRLLQGRALVELSKLRRDEGNLPDALATEERARDILEALSREQPVVADHRIELAGAWDEVGVTHYRAARFAEARASFEHAREVLEKIGDQRVEGMDMKNLRQLAQVYRHLGMVQRLAGRHEMALSYYESALRLQERLAREQPGDPWIRANLAGIYYNFSNLLRDSGRSGSIEACERANAIFEPLVREYRSIAEFRIMYARSLGNLATMTHSTRSISAYSRVADLQREEVELHPGVFSFRIDLALTLYHLAQDHLDADQPNEALRYAQEGTDRLAAFPVTEKELLGQAMNLLGMNWQKQAEALVALGREHEAVEAIGVAIRHQVKAIEQNPRSDKYKEELFNHSYQLAAIRCIMGQTQETASSIAALEPLWTVDWWNLFADARDLSRAWSKPIVAAGERTRRSGTATQLYGTLVVKILERSVQAGFRDFLPLINDPAFAPFRARQDFQRLLVHMMDLAFPADVFAR